MAKLPARQISTAASVPTLAYGAGAGTNPGQYTITSAVPSDANTTATITTGAIVHGYTVGQSVVIAGVVVSAGNNYNGTFVITATPTTTTFKYALVNGGTYSSGGTATVSLPLLLNGNDYAGTVQFGAGTTPVAGAYVVVTFGNPALHRANCIVMLTWQGSAGGNVVARATSVSASAFTITMSAALTANAQVNNYQVSYLVIDTQ